MLREVGVTGRILVLCGLYPGEEEEALRNSLTPAVSRLEQAQDLARAAARMGREHRAAIHLKIDTGMGRLGLPLAELDSFAEAAKRLPEIELEGVFSHLASSEILDDEHTAHQRSSATMPRSAPWPITVCIRPCAISPIAARSKDAGTHGTTSCGPACCCTDMNMACRDTMTSL